MNKVFETFNINQKIEGLKHNNFTGQDVAIIVPTFDKLHRLIKEYDQPLYWAQKKNASMLLHHIVSKQNSGSVCILYDKDEVNETDRKFDHMIFLYEFTASEQAEVLDGLRENNKNLQIIELC